MGEYGIGKTTSAENLLSIIYGVPKNVLVTSTIRGNPELTQEKITGRPHFGELNKGIEKVIWSLFVTLEPKIIDELNRIPPSKQNIFLDGIDRGNWQYLNEMIHTGDVPVFFTVNYKDSGNNPTVEAVLDRIEIAVESRHPGVNPMRVIRGRYGNNKWVDITKNDAIEDQMYSAMLNGKPYAEKKKAVRNLQDKFKKEVETKTGLRLLSTQELEEITHEMNSIPLSNDADLFLDVLISEFYKCMKFGQKRSNEECVTSCHYQHLLCGKKKNSDSVRNQAAELKYSKSLAWLFGESEVKTKHIVSVLPYLLWHKTNFVESYVKDFRKDDREDPLELYVAKKTVNELANRASNLKNEQYKAIQMIRDDKMKQVKQLAKDVDHPVLYDYVNLT